MRLPAPACACLRLPAPACVARILCPFWKERGRRPAVCLRPARAHGKRTAGRCDGRGFLRALLRPALSWPLLPTSSTSSSYHHFPAFMPSDHQPAARQPTHTSAPASAVQHQQTHRRPPSPPTSAAETWTTTRAASQLQLLYSGARAGTASSMSTARRTYMYMYIYIRRFITPFPPLCVVSTSFPLPVCEPQQPSSPTSPPSSSAHRQSRRGQRCCCVLATPAAQVLLPDQRGLLAPCWSFCRIPALPCSALFCPETEVLKKQKKNGQAVGLPSVSHSPCRQLFQFLC